MTVGGCAAEIDMVLTVVCEIMGVAPHELPGKTTPRTRPRLCWARNMASLVLHERGLSDGRIARAFGHIHRVTILVRRRRMAAKLQTTALYRDFHAAIWQRVSPPAAAHDAPFAAQVA